MEESKKERDVQRGKEHHEETHGKSGDIDESIPVGNVKGPGIFQRAKEEIEAIVEAIHPKKDQGDEHGK